MATPVPVLLSPALRRLSRRLSLGLFLERWPRWAAGALLAAGSVTLVCRLFVPAAAPYLYWLLAIPALAAIPAAVASFRRAYRPEQVLALADSLSGGGGLVLSIAERPDAHWERAPQVMQAAGLRLPRLRPARRLAVAVPALAFLLAALLLPQRAPAFGSTAIADEIAADLSAKLAELQARQEVTPEEAEQLEEDIAELQRAARERMDAATWEAADALDETLAARSAARRDAAQWAQDAMARYRAAVAGGLDASSATAGAAQEELAQALAALAKTGALAAAPPGLRSRLGSGATVPIDAATLGELADYLAGLDRAGTLRAFGDGDTQFDPAEFALDPSPDGDGIPGRGGINRGRADAELTFGDETSPAGQLEAQALPPGYVRGPDDWAPIVTMPGVPEAAPQGGVRSAARSYRDDAGQAAWRRTLAPRHQSAVRKYFQQ